MAARTTMIEGVLKECRGKIECIENLTVSERRGLKKLAKRVKNKEIVIWLTDKSGKMCVSTVEKYEEAGEAHTEHDEKVSWEDVEEVQKDIKCHMKGLNRVFRPGMSHSERNMERCFEAKELKTTAIPRVKLLMKDHKEPGTDGVLKTRPVCTACRSPNGELSEYLADILDAAAEASDSSEEAISTEDLLSMVDKVSSKILGLGLEEDKIFVGSLDAVSLYPSLVIDKVSRMCGERVRESGMKFENIDITWACKYVALAMDENEVVRRNMQDVIPRRKAKQGKKATMRTVVVDDLKERWKFLKSP